MRIVISVFLILSTHFAFSQNAQFKKGVKAFEAHEWAKAVTNLTPAADAGDASAQFMVGCCYFNEEFYNSNDSIAALYLLKSAFQQNTEAMNTLVSLFYKMSYVDRAKLIDAYVWAEISHAYKPVPGFQQPRNAMKRELSESEFKESVKRLTEYKKQLDKINLSALTTTDFDHSIDLVKFTSTKETLLTDDLFRDWINRWKRERFQCDTFYYTETIEPAIIDSAINQISTKAFYEQTSLYNGDLKENILLTLKEQGTLIEELERLKTNSWPEGLFPQSKRISQIEIAPTLQVTEKLSTETAKYMCSIVYTFSKPIFFRHNTIALFLDQKTYRGNYTQLTFTFYTFEYDRWIPNSDVYVYFESSE